MDEWRRRVYRDLGVEQPPPHGGAATAYREARRAFEGRVAEAREGMEPPQSGDPLRKLVEKLGTLIERPGESVSPMEAVGRHEGAYGSNPALAHQEARMLAQQARVRQQEEAARESHPEAEPRGQSSEERFLAETPDEKRDEVRRVASDHSHQENEDYLNDFLKKHKFESKEELGKEMFGPRSSFLIKGHPFFNMVQAISYLHNERGERIGEMERQFHPEDNYVKHSFFELEREHQKTDVGKELLAKQMGLYRRMGLKRVDMRANLDIGGYAWSRYGFVPSSDETWKQLKKTVEKTFRGMKQAGLLTPEDVEDFEGKILRSNDPRSVWDIADKQHLVDSRFGTAPSYLDKKKKVPLGKALLIGTGWDGRFDLRNEEQKQRFEDYISRKKER